MSWYTVQLKVPSIQGPFPSPELQKSSSCQSLSCLLGDYQVGGQSAPLCGTQRPHASQYILSASAPVFLRPMLFILSCQQGMCARALNPWCESLELHMQEEFAFCPKREISTLGGGLSAFSAGPTAAICAWGWSVMKRSHSLLSSCSSLLSVDVINHHDRSTQRKVVSCYVLQPAQKGSWDRKLGIGTKTEAMKTAR